MPYSAKNTSRFSNFVTNVSYLIFLGETSIYLDSQESS